MADYTGEQLSGAGIAIPELIAGTEYQFVMVIPTTLSGSGYFTVETVRDEMGFYNSISLTNAIGTYTDFVNTPLIGFITSSYISSIVCDKSTPTAVSYKFSPAVTVPAGTSLLRSTGGIGLQLNATVFVFTNKAQLVTAVDLWISNRTGAITLYGEINTWDVSAITDMSDLFDSKTTFNSDISNWNVSNVTDMTNMFQGATAFNSPINNWDVRKVTNISRMFNFASSFQQPLNLWDLNSLVTADLFMGSTGVAGAITYTLLDTLYNGWVIDFAALQPNVTIDFGDSTFTSAGLAAKNILVNNKGWTIFDDGQV